jgi:hypothetical protein
VFLCSVATEFIPPLLWLCEEQTPKVKRGKEGDLHQCLLSDVFTGESTFACALVNQGNNGEGDFRGADKVLLFRL